MTTELPITKYNPTRAKWYFALFKFLELFGVFLFTFGFYGLGSLIYKYFPEFYNHITANDSNPIGYLSMWCVGFITFLGIVLVLIVTSGALYLIYKIIQAWIMGNWNLAKRVTEDKTAKAKRLKQQGIEDKKADRKKWGYCVGDEAKYICTDNDAINKARLGQKCKILKIDSEGDIRPEWEDGTVGSYSCDYKYIYSTSFKITKKQPLK